MTTREIFDKMQKRMDANPEKLAGIKAVYQFNITGADPGAYRVTVSDKKAVVAEGTFSSPDITIIMASNDFVNLVEGKLGSVMAFTTGKLKLKGDMMLAMKLESLLK